MPKKNEKGKTEIRKICEFGINLDERIADGFYFAKSIQLAEYIAKNPELLLDDFSFKPEKSLFIIGFNIFDKYSII